MFYIFLTRQNTADAGSSDEFDTESSIPVSKKPIQNRSNRRSRSYSRSRMKERSDDSSASNNIRNKRTTFMTDKNENNGGGAGGSIKSNSSYDTSKISFQDFMLNTLEQNYFTY